MYRLTVYPEARDQIAALPLDALSALAEVLDVIALSPWNGAPQHEDNLNGAVRRWIFGSTRSGQVIYLVLDDQREVHVLLVQWLA